MLPHQQPCQCRDDDERGESQASQPYAAARKDVSCSGPRGAADHLCRDVCEYVRGRQYEHRLTHAQIARRDPVDTEHEHGPMPEVECERDVTNMVKGTSAQKAVGTEPVTGRAGDEHERGSRERPQCLVTGKGAGRVEDESAAEYEGQSDPTQQPADLRRPRLLTAHRRDREGEDTAEPQLP